MIWTEPGLSWLLVVVAGVASGGFQAYTSLRRRYASLELLQASAELSGRTPQPAPKRRQIGRQDPAGTT